MHLAHFLVYIIQHSAMNSTSEYLNTVSSLGTGWKRGEGIRKRLGCEAKEDGRKKKSGRSCHSQEQPSNSSD